MNPFEIIGDYLSFDFVKFAFVAIVFISLACAILGVTLVLKRYSMMGDGLSHVAFGALAIATVLNVTDLYITLPITIAVAVVLLVLSNKGKVKNDAFLAMFTVGSLSLGYLLINLFSASGNISGDVCTSLFGSTSILTLKMTDVWACVIVALIVLVFFIIFHNRIFSITFDESFAKSTGNKTNLYNLAIAVITGIVTVMAMKLVGSLLVSALIIFPAISAIRLFRSYKMVIIFSGIFGVVSSLLGLLIAILLSTPVGATIVIIDVIGYAFCYGCEKVLKA